MDTSLLAPLALYSFVSTATPGPNNIMLASSGLVFGFRRTIPHIFGINFGCALMLVLSGLGLGALFEAWPVLRWAVRICQYACRVLRCRQPPPSGAKQLALPCASAVRELAQRNISEHAIRFHM